MSMIITLTFMLFPILGIVLTSIFYITNNSKKINIVCSVLIGLFMGLIAYNFIPMSSYDLTRHHQIVETLFFRDFSYIFQNFSYMDLEILPLIICYLVSLFQNVNLLQFIVVTIGYSIIFYILGDYKINQNVKNYRFLLVAAFTFFSFNALYFISGLWNYLAIIVFSLVMYIDYMKKGNKLICYPLYALTLLIHNSMIFPLVILIIYKLFGNKFNFRSAATTIIIVLLPATLLGIINNTFDISLLKTIEQTYNSYFINDESMYRFYGGKTLLMEFGKVALILFTIIFQPKGEKLKNLNGFLILLTVAILLMLPKSIVMIRFVMILGFLGIIPLMDSLKIITKNRVIYVFILLMITLLFAITWCHIMSAQNFDDLFSSKIFGTIFNYFK